LTEHTFKLYAADTVFAGAVDDAMLFEETAKKAGINPKAVRVPNDGYWDDVWMKKEMYKGLPTAPCIPLPRPYPL
jgi:peptide/nickel transport system substrate-binding protein